MTDIKIDYDNIDVPDIMKQIQAKAASMSKKSPTSKQSSAPEKPSPPKKSHPPKTVSQLEKPSSIKMPSPPKKNEPLSKPASQIPEPEQVPMVLPKWRRILLKLMRPFSPLIKLLILPVHHELLQTIYNLDHVNKRLDYFNTKTEQSLIKVSGELYSTSEKLDLKVDGLNQTINERLDLAFQRLDLFNHSVSERLDNFSEEMEIKLTKLSEELFSVSEKMDSKIDSFKERLDQIFLRLEDLDKTREYIKLLHSLCHNIVVELTKLKIEEESAKVKIRIMEKDFEFLSRKEQILEKKSFK